MTVFETLQTAAYLSLGLDRPVSREAFVVAAQAAWCEVTGEPFFPVPAAADEDLAPVRQLPVTSGRFVITAS